MIRRLIILLLIVGCDYAQKDTIDIMTFTNIDFIYGFITAFIFIAIIYLLSIIISFIKLRHLKEKEDLMHVEDLTFESIHLDNEAVKIVKKYKKKLMMTKNPDPELIDPLFLVSKEMIQEISKHFYPDSPEPLFEPKITDITQTAILICNDINQFIHQNRFSKLLDVKVKKIGQIQRFLDKKPMKGLKKIVNGKIGNTIKWSYRAVRYKNPWTYFYLAGKNLGVRLIHSKMIKLIGLRAIILYDNKIDGNILRIEQANHL